MTKSGSSRDNSGRNFILSAPVWRNEASKVVGEGASRSPYQHEESRKPVHLATSGQ